MKIYSKQLPILLATLVLLIGCGNPKGQITIKGKVEVPDAEKQVLVYKLGEKGLEVSDTLEISPEGKFVTDVMVTQPTFYRISFYNRQYVNLVLNGTESKVEIELNGTDAQTKPVITGAPENGYLDKFDEIFKYQNDDVQALNQDAIKARMDQDEVKLSKITDDYYALIANNQEKLKNYMLSIAPSIAVFYGLGSLKIEEHIPFFEKLSGIYNEKLPGHPLSLDLSNRVSNVKKLAVGSEAPEISLPGVDGQEIKLSSLRGKYVLIDFWAAWCRPCRAENPNVVQMYNRYKGQNFEILGVSLDRNREAWVNAIQEDRLPWLHVSDLKYFNSEAATTYRIEAIPATYLIGPDGKIIAKGLRGPSLEEKLKEIFG